MAMQVKDLTIDQLKTIIRETVQDSLAALVKELKIHSSQEGSVLDVCFLAKWTIQTPSD